MKRIERLKYARQVLLAQDKLALKYQRIILAELKKTADELSSAYRESGQLKFDSVQRQHQSRMYEILTTLVRATGKTFMAMPVRSVKSAAPVFDNQIEQQIYSMLAVNALSSSGAIADVTIATASAVIMQVMANAVNDPVAAEPDNVAAAIAKKIGGISARGRAMTIARTETHNAANMAQFERAKSSAEIADLDVMVEWIATNDGRVRDNHRHADGQKQPIGTPFNVGGDKMKYPGDRSGGSAANTINCRCVLGYHVPED